MFSKIEKVVKGKTLITFMASRYPSINNCCSLHFTWLPTEVKFQPQLNKIRFWDEVNEFAIKVFFPRLKSLPRSPLFSFSNDFQPRQVKFSSKRWWERLEEVVNSAKRVCNFFCFEQCCFIFKWPCAGFQVTSQVHVMTCFLILIFFLSLSFFILLNFFLDMLI